MHHVALAPPMEQRDVDHVDGFAEEHAKLTYPLGIRPVATADEQRAWVEPDHVTAFEQTGRFDSPVHAERVAERLEEAPLRIWFRLTCRLAHPAQDDAVRADDRRVPRVQG